MFWILREVALHQHLVPEMVVLRTPKTANGRSSPPLSVLIFVLLEGKGHHQRLLAVVTTTKLTYYDENPRDDDRQCHINS